MEVFCKAFIFIIFATFVSREVLAAQHLVGGTNGWDESTDFNSWASAQTFKAGDTLVFKYATGLHSVVELPDESAYKNCDLGSLLDTKSSGNDAIKLTKPGTRFFACGTPGHCAQGMKVKITTAAGNAASTPASSSSSSSSTATSGSSALHSPAFSPVLLIVSFLGALWFCVF